MSTPKKSIYRVFFTLHEKNYEIYAQKVSQAEMYGFIEIEGLLFNERSHVVVDPAEEALRREFGGVRKLLVPFQSIQRIDEVEKQGQARIIGLPRGNGSPPESSVGRLPPAGGPGVT
jgi:hypothetical protein